VGPVLHAAASGENFAQTKDFGAMGSTEICNVRVKSHLLASGRQCSLWREWYYGEEVLVVEDEEPIRDVLQSLLERAGYKPVLNLACPLTTNSRPVLSFAAWTIPGMSLS
jgi:hypothetical protein